MESFVESYLERLKTLNQKFADTFNDLPAEALDWQPGTDMNSFCVLVVHTTGSARFWIGVALGSPPERNRALEFQAQGLSHDELRARFATLEDYASGALKNFDVADFPAVRTIPNDTPCSAGWALLHALEHTGLHLGHAQITRQLWQQR